MDCPISCKRRRLQCTLGVRIEPQVSPAMLRYQAARASPAQLSEVTAIVIPGFDRGLSSVWLDEHRVVCGTRDGTLLEIDTRDWSRWRLPLIASPDGDRLNCCGVSCLGVNPSRSILATRGADPDSLALYSLPSLNQLAATCSTFRYECLSSLSWISDTLLLTATREGTHSIWDVSSGTPVERCYNRDVLMQRACAHDFDQRYTDTGVCVDAATQIAASVSIMGVVHIWDIHERLVATTSTQLQNAVCNCIDYCSDLGVFVVGTGARAAFVDHRTGRQEFAAPVNCDVIGGGVWSVAMNSMVATLGTGSGTVLFYDARRRDFVRHHPCQGGDDVGEAVILKTHPGLVEEEQLDGLMLSLAQAGTRRGESRTLEFPNAVSTLCYNPSSTNLFAAGGPWPVGLRGYFASLYAC